MVILVAVELSLQLFIRQAPETFDLPVDAPICLFELSPRGAGKRRLVAGLACAVFSFLVVQQHLGQRRLHLSRECMADFMRPSK